jgi:hexosaminidase
MRRYWVVPTCLVLFSIVASPAEHNALLPRPQEAHYGPGRINVRGLAIHLSPTPAEEDRFAADTLAKRLDKICGQRLPVGESTAGDHAILLKRTGPVSPLPVPDERPGPDSREFYTLRVTPAGVELEAKSSASLFYGVQTLVQLVEGRGAEASFPEVEIHDWPALAYRGTMIDMSHGPLPTEEEVKRQLDFMARWKANQYYFYNEASIELDDYPLVNPDGRFTKDQVRRIIAYGRERHIDVVPCLELYGHLHDLFRLERYSDLSPLAHGGEFDPRNPRVASLLSDWINQFAELFPSPFVHIGFDETWETEQATQKGGAASTPAKLFLDQLRRVAGQFSDRGKRVMAWGDIVVKYPDIMAELPPGLISVAWEYDPDDPDYKSRLGPLAAKKITHSIASGVTVWNQIAPDFERSFANIDTFLAAGRRSGALGLINTVWTDDAQTLLRMSWPGIAYGVIASWQAAPVDRPSFFSDYASLMYPSQAASDVAAGLDALTKAETAIQAATDKQSMLAFWDDPFHPDILKRSVEHRAGLHQARQLAEDAQEHFDRALRAGAAPLTLTSLLLGSRMVDYAGMRFQSAIEVAELWQTLGPHPTDQEFWNKFASEVIYQDHGRLADQMDAISELAQHYRAAWLAEYTPYRLNEALSRWDAELEFWRALQARFQLFERTRKREEPLPPLEFFTKTH